MITNGIPNKFFLRLKALFQTDILLVITNEILTGFSAFFVLFMFNVVGRFKNRQRDERAGFAEQRGNDNHRFDRRAYEENRPQVIGQNLQIRRL